MECRKERGKLILDTKVPKGVEAELVLDRDPQLKQTLTHNGVRLNLDSKRQKTHENGMVLEPSEIHLQVHGGNHTVELSSQ